ncbi:MAG: hypothetical protein WC466_10400, partial [Candidatus Izemoplasmatales bacterium]
MTKRKKMMKRSKRENLVGWAFLSVWVLGFLLFMAYPLITSFYYSLSQVTLEGEGIQVQFIAFENYRRIFSSAPGFSFLESVSDFALEILFKVPIITVFAIIIAVMLNQKIKLRGFFRAIYFLPVIIA